MPSTTVSTVLPVPIPLSSITCVTSNPIKKFNTNSKVYDKGCKSVDFLLDDSGSGKAKKNNSIRQVKKMMANPSSSDLTQKQDDLIASIKMCLFNPNIADPLEPQKIAAVLFDMKALGDITQFEYFIENLELFETFETHDTILLLLAIICIGDKHADLTYNLQTKNRICLYFATAFTKSGDTVPYYYGFSIEHLKTIYDKICELVKKAPAFPSYLDDETMLLLLKVFARILDSCHDFLNDKTKEEEDEAEGELLIIEHYLNSFFNPAD
jgi:hypothetical protein